MKLLIVMSLFTVLTAACSSTSDDKNLNGEAKLEEPVNPSAEAAKEVSPAIDDKVANAAPESQEKVAESAPAAPVPEQAAPPVETPPPAADAPKAENINESGVYPTTSLLNLRSGPGMSHAVSRIAKFGEVISLSGESKNHWLKTTDGLWVYKNLVVSSKPSKPNDPVVAAPAAVEVEAPKAEAEPASSEASPSEASAKEAVKSSATDSAESPSDDAAQSPAAE